MCIPVFSTDTPLLVRSSSDSALGPQLSETEPSLSEDTSEMVRNQGKSIQRHMLLCHWGFGESERDTHLTKWQQHELHPVVFTPKHWSLANFYKSLQCLCSQIRRVNKNFKGCPPGLWKGASHFDTVTQIPRWQWMTFWPKVGGEVLDQLSWLTSLFWGTSSHTR